MLRFIIAKPLINILFIFFLYFRSKRPAKVSQDLKNYNPAMKTAQFCEYDREREKTKEEMNCNGTGNGCDVLAC